MPDKSFTCSDYCGLSCVDGSCPNALSEEYPDFFCGETSCEECGNNKGCEDCCVAFCIGMTADSCRQMHESDWKSRMKTIPDYLRMIRDDVVGASGIRGMMLMIAYQMMYDGRC